MAAADQGQYTADNLGLSYINGSDYVSPKPINDNFKKLDALGLDYVVLTGYSGEWWFRKWKSGRAECGIDTKNFGNVVHKTPWSNWFISVDLSFGAFPFAFAAPPFVSISFNGSSDARHRSYISYRGANSTTMSPAFNIVDPNSSTAENAYFGIYVNGRYK